MTSEPAGDIRQMDGPAALPLKNGELVFEEPWQGRVFGIVGHGALQFQPPAFLGLDR